MTSLATRNPGPYSMPLMIAFVILASFVWQIFNLSPDQVEAMAIIPRQVLAGHWTLLISSIFLHGSWLHVLSNSLYSLVFAAPCARFMGARSGKLSLIPLLKLSIFFLICGVLAGIGYAISAYGTDQSAIGASGAASGLFAGALRLDAQGQCRKLTDGQFVRITLVFFAINVASQFISTMPGIEAGQIAWQDHIAGYIAGAILVPLFRSRKLT